MFWKILIVLILVGYVFHKVTSFIFRGFTGRNQFDQRQYNQGSRKAPNSNLDIDSIPHKRSKKADGFSGGEYVDYEEVK